MLNKNCLSRWIAAALVSLCIISCTACNDSRPVSQQDSSSIQTSASSVSVSATEDAPPESTSGSSASTEDPTATQPSDNTEVSASNTDPTDETVSLTEEATSQPQDITLESVEEPQQSTEDFTAESTPTEQTTGTSSTTTSSTVATTTKSTTTTVATTTTQATTTTAATTTAPPPVEVTIPQIRKSVASGEKVLSADNACIDYSNSSEGYVGVSYDGASARAKLRIIGNGVTEDHDLAVGGKIEFFPLTQGSGDYKIEVYEQLDGKFYSPVLKETISVSISDENSMYLYPNKYSNFHQDSDCVALSAKVCAGKSGTIEKLAAIFAYITDNITYDYDLAASVKSGYIPDPDSTLKKKKGICFDYASLVTAMARTQGIPTRLVIGYAADNIYHAWNEVYTKETGWISAELLLKQKGYNIVDATFYAGAENKAAIAEYISNNGNYSAIYRY